MQMSAAMRASAGERSRVVGKLDYLNNALLLRRFDENPLHRRAPAAAAPERQRIAATKPTLRLV